MGRLTHAEGLRLVKNRSWQSRWHGSQNYQERLHKDLGFEEYVSSLIGGEQYRKSGLIFSHLFISRVSEGIKVDVYVYDGPWDANKGLMDKVLKKRLEVFAETLEKEGKLYFGEKVIVEVCGISKEWITSEVVARYIGVKLKQNYSLAEILGGLKRTLELNSNILGYRIDCSGRYSRRQRASKRSLKYGRVPLNSLDASIEYGFSRVTLRFGVCGIKVWLFKKDGKRVGLGYKMKRILK